MDRPASAALPPEALPSAPLTPGTDRLGIPGGFGRRSLQVRIASGVFAGLAVLFALFGLLALRTISLSTDFALEERLRLAQTTAESVDQLLQQSARQLERVAATVASAGTEEEQMAAAAAANAVLGQFGRLVKLTPNGEVGWVVPPEFSAATWRFATDPVVRDAMAAGSTSVAPPERGLDAGDLVVLVITPVHRQGSRAGFLAGELDISQGKPGLLPVPPEDSSIHYEIVDGAGLIVAGSGAGEETQPDEHLRIVVPLIAGRQSGTALHEAQGEDHVVAFYPFAAFAGGVVVEQTQDDALVIPRDMQRTTLLYGIGALLAASLAAWLHAGSVVRPIRRLTTEAARMASGDLDRPVAITREDEIGELARRFDEMRLKLRASLAESARWAEELEHRVDLRTREVDERNRELHALNRVRRQLLAKTITAQEEERKRLARDLHDDSAQTLTAVLMTLKSAEDALTVDPAASKAALAQSRSQLEVALRDIRKAIGDLRPSALDDLGLASAIRAYGEERLRAYAIGLSLATSGDERRATGAAATAIFRIIQEAISNVAQHSGATNARVSLDFGPRELLAVVEDDGHGFAPGALRRPDESGRGLGLLGMRERAALFGGEVDIESRPGMGTVVRIRMPLK